MNHFQRLWWQQATSDYEVLLLLRKQSSPACHQLHYLQMVTEKLSKAYFWRSGKSPGSTHAIFRAFLKALNDRSSRDRENIAKLLGFAGASGYRAWLRQVGGLVLEVEQLAPALSQDGPNPEYPWPLMAPREAPANHDFTVWRNLVGSRSGRQLLTVIDRALIRFPEYA